MSEIALRIEPGYSKYGAAEPIPPLEFRSGDVVALVGPTGSGKTRLLADIERLAKGDSPTRRRISLIGLTDDSSGWAIARISQTMQFFLDLTVEEFIHLHSTARGKNIDPAIVISQANRLAGEPFDGAQHLANLSGGQARALMVADVILISDAPILLIDEIENAGIDRHEALKFLIERRRIVFVATHDPLIALKASCRLVMADGAIKKKIVTSQEERKKIRTIAAMDRRLMELRALIRSGGTLT